MRRAHSIRVQRLKVATIARMKIVAPTSIWFYKTLLVLATLFWGFSFVVVKGALDDMTPGWLTSIRFLLTALIVGFVCRKTIRRHFSREHILYGCVLGIVAFFAFWVQNVGLTDTTPGRNAFLTGTYCVIVPFLYWAIDRKRPTIFNIVAALLCIGGVGFISLGHDLSFALRWGDGLTLFSACFIALHMVFVAKFAKGHDMLTLTFFQLLSSSVFGMLISTFAEPLPAMAAFASTSFLVQMGYLVIFASALAMVFQNLGQTRVPPTQASLILSLESVFGVIFSVLLYGEDMTLQLFVGFALIFTGLVISETLPRPKKYPDPPEKFTGALADDED